MEYIVYETINLINNKIYIGVHKTRDSKIFDGYIGCGVSINNPSMYMNPKTPFQYAVRKYGIKNFKRTILQVFNTLEEALQLEKQLVNADFIKREDTYNISLGGNMGNYYFPINQFDKNGNLIKSWDNMALAAEALGVSYTSINNAKLFKGSCQGYFWSTDNTIDINEYSYHVGTPTYKYSCNGKLVDSFDSVTEAAKDAGCKEKTIYRAIKMSMKRGEYYYSFQLTDSFVPTKCPPLKGKIIYIYDLDGNYITELKSGHELKDYFKIQSYNCLKQALLNGTPYKGVQVSLTKEEKLGKAQKSTNSSKRVGCYNLNGELLEEFDSIKQATKKHGSGVFRVLNNRQKQTKGLIFRLI